MIAIYIFFKLAGTTNDLVGLITSQPHSISLIRIADNVIEGIFAALDTIVIVM